jgi:hypothetical protein
MHPEIVPVIVQQVRDSFSLMSIKLYMLQLFSPYISPGESEFIVEAFRAVAGKIEA